jgi:hypothetical protein
MLSRMDFIAICKCDKIQLFYEKNIVGWPRAISRYIFLHDVRYMKMGGDEHAYLVINNTTKYVKKIISWMIGSVTKQYDNTLCKCNMKLSKTTNSF